jgi:hypothetical protein
VKKNVLWRALLLAIAAIFCITSAAVKTATSLDKVPGLLKTPEGKKVFREQMAGRPAPDKLGLSLPAGLTDKDITGLLIPGSNAPLNTIGAKPLASQPDLYIAIVCTGGDLPTTVYDTRCAQSQTSEVKPSLQITLGLIEVKPGAPPHLAAKPLVVDLGVDWGHADLSSAPDALGDATGDTIRPDEIDGFDLAPYRIALATPAFGVRGSWMDGYSGGMASYSALYLFAVIDGALKQVFATPMSAYKDIAGDWNKDGTRQHDITDTANVLVISTHQTDGYFNLILKSRSGRAHRLFRWSAIASAYRASGG